MLFTFDDDDNGAVFTSTEPKIEATSDTISQEFIKVEQGATEDKTSSALRPM